MTSSNLRNQATIQDGRVIVQNVQGRQTEGYKGSGAKANANGTGGNKNMGNSATNQAKVIRCYNYKGEGYMARQCYVNFKDSIKEVVTETMTKLTSQEYMEEVQAYYVSNSTTPRFDDNAKFELGVEFLKILQDNAFNRINGDDVVDHTAKVLAILELIKIPNVDPNQLRQDVFPLSLFGDARKWWIDEIDGKITTWGELTEKLYNKYYRLSHTCNNTSFSNYMDDGPDYLNFINWLNSKFKNHRRMDGKTKNALWKFWIKGGDEKVLLDDIVSSDDKWKEYDNTNHLNHNFDPLFKPYFYAQEVNNICTFKKGRGCFDKR
ncbi:hypothetical protein Tco_1032337 [Tanacetum coccineum]|uniref:Uncharacterized protein n=1 Tax=Tanacetum coccineum TaxID=301880 RepID=A0ABQ5GBN2_9ASTR